MRTAILVLLVTLTALVCFAQTLETLGPDGRMKLCPKPPIHNPNRPLEIPDPYTPSPMQLIPAGEYEMGDHSGIGWPDIVPVHAVYIDAFYMDRFQVTNKEYCRFLNYAYHYGWIKVSSLGAYRNVMSSYRYCSLNITYPYHSRITWNSISEKFGVLKGKNDHPMVEVTWYGAVAYANWRSTMEGLPQCYNLDTWECTFGAGGFRLPTEAEREKAARGGEFNPYYRSPWGNSYDGSKANYWESGDPYEGTYPLPETTPVGYYDGNQIPTGLDMANGYGLYDMAGNVFDWCNDWYDDTYYQYCVDNGIYDNPTGPSGGIPPTYFRVLRGGSWYTFGAGMLCAGRAPYKPGDSSFDFGFRLVREIP